MGLFKSLFGPKPKPEPIQPEPAPDPTPAPAPIVPLGQTYGVMPSSPDTATLEQAEQMQMLAMELANQNAILSHHAAAVEAVVEQAQKLYGTQVSHQYRLQDLQRQRFPIDLMAAGLFQPPTQPAPTAEPKEPRRSGLKSRVGKAIRD